LFYKRFSDSHDPVIVIGNVPIALFFQAIWRFPWSRLCIGKSPNRFVFISDLAIPIISMDFAESFKSLCFISDLRLFHRFLGSSKSLCFPKRFQRFQRFRWPRQCNEESLKSLCFPSDLAISMNLLDIAESFKSLCFSKRFSDSHGPGYALGNIQIALFL
jgi:hypothetical protein